MRHPLTAELEHAGAAADALRALLLADGEPAEREIVADSLAHLAAILRVVRWHTPTLRRAALRLAGVLEDDAGVLQHDLSTP